jgi:hypothetical protein
MILDAMRCAAGAGAALKCRESDKPIAARARLSKSELLAARLPRG